MFKMEHLVLSCLEGEEECLAKARVCLINATGFGCEALKNLVIPGVAMCFVIDSTTIAQRPNFFLEDCPSGDKTANACVRMMSQLNEDLVADCNDASVSDIKEQLPEFLKDFELVLATNLKESEIVALSKACWETNTPLIYARSVNFFGSIRTQIRNHIVINRDKKYYDLRLHQPFAPLKDFVENTPLVEKVPWLLVLYKYLKKWQGTYGEDLELPTNPENIQEIVEMLQADGIDKRESYDELLALLESVYSFDGKPTFSMVEIFNRANEMLSDHEGTLQPFWVIMSAIRDFVVEVGNGFLPLSCNLPELFYGEDKLSSNLIEIYEQKSFEDVSWVFERSKLKLQKLNLTSNLMKMELIETLIAKLPNMDFMVGKPIFEEYTHTPETVNMIQDELDSTGTPPFIQSYIVFRAFERLAEEEEDADEAAGNEQGEAKALDVEDVAKIDIEKFKATVYGIMAEWGMADAGFNDDLFNEICNYGSSELEAISIQLGGCISDLALVIVSHQSANLEGTLMLNGLSGDVKTLEF